MYYSPDLIRFWETLVQIYLIGGHFGKVRFWRIFAKCYFELKMAWKVIGHVSVDLLDAINAHEFP